MTDVIGYGGQRFNRLAGGGASVGVPGIDVGEALKGCCNGIFKFAYIVSAPLHKQGFFDFWASPDLSIADKAAVAGDLLLHLCFWFVPFAFELWGSLQDKRGNYIAQELQQGSAQWHAARKSFKTFLPLAPPTRSHIAPPPP